jgi:hypothetical protein
MLRFFAPQRSGAAIFARQFGDPPPPPPDPGNSTPPPPVVQVTKLSAGVTSSTPTVTTGQILLDREFGTVEAPEERTMLIALPGDIA